MNNDRRWDMTIDYGWVSESLRATAEKRDGTITALLGIELAELHRIRRYCSRAPTSGAHEAAMIRQSRLPEKLFRWWRRLEAMTDVELDTEMERFRARVEQQRRKPSRTSTTRTPSRNERLGKPYTGKHAVTPRVYKSGPIPGWWHGGE